MKRAYRDYYILKMDIRKYFNSIDKKILYKILTRRIKDEKLLWLIRQILTAQKRQKGIEIGNYTSQTFANIYLNELDQYATRKLKVSFYYRYMDDIVILFKTKKDAKEAMAKVGTDKAPAYVYMIASPGEEEEYVKGIEDVVGCVPVFGGSAADDSISGDWKIFTNDKCFSDGVAVAFFYTNKSIRNKYTGAYHETVNSGIVTKLNGRRQLVEIDGKPALNVYAKWTGKKVKDLAGMNLLSASVTEPLGVKDRLGSLIAIRHPMIGNEDLSMNVGNNLAINTAVIQMQASVDELIEATGKTLKNVRTNLPCEAGAYLLIHSGERKLGINERIEEVAERLKKEAKGVPFLTVFTFGEYGTEDHGENTCGRLMLSFTGFGKNK